MRHILKGKSLILCCQSAVGRTLSTLYFELLLINVPIFLPFVPVFSSSYVCPLSSYFCACSFCCFPNASSSLQRSTSNILDYQARKLRDAYVKYCKNCQYCPMSLFIEGLQLIDVLNYQKCNQYFKDLKSLGSLFEGVLWMSFSLSLPLSLSLSLRFCCSGQISLFGRFNGEFRLSLWSNV